MQIDMRCTYAIDDAHGNQITGGVPWQMIENLAQEIADRRGEAVYFYAITGPNTDAESVRVAPSEEAVR